MNSSPNRFEAVWSWHRVACCALNVFEKALNNPEKHLSELAELAAESESSVLLHLGICRAEMENFALLSLWAIFEEAINDWLTQRVKWVGVASELPELDEDIRKGLAKRVQHWTIGEKIDALKKLIGEDSAKDLHAVRKWRDWVAHRKTGARPIAVDFEIAQSLLIGVLMRLETCPESDAEALS